MPKKLPPLTNGRRALAPDRLAFRSRNLTALLLAGVVSVAAPVLSAVDDTRSEVFLASNASLSYTSETPEQLQVLFDALNEKISRTGLPAFTLTLGVWEEGNLFRIAGLKDPEGEEIRTRGGLVDISPLLAADPRLSDRVKVLQQLTTRRNQILAFAKVRQEVSEEFPALLADALAAVEGDDALRQMKLPDQSGKRIGRWG